MEKITVEPIGYIESPYKKQKDVPFQSVLKNQVRARIILDQAYEEGLKDLETFSHIVVSFYFHESRHYHLQTKTPWDEDVKGVFATRSPKRPNYIGISIVKLIEIKGNIIEIEGIDMLDNTPVLDIKPYIDSLNPENANKGWLGEELNK